MVSYAANGLVLVTYWLEAVRCAGRMILVGPSGRSFICPFLKGSSRAVWLPRRTWWFFFLLFATGRFASFRWSLISPPFQPYWDTQVISVFVAFVFYFFFLCLLFPLFDFENLNYPFFRP